MGKLRIRGRICRLAGVSAGLWLGIAAAAEADAVRPAPEVIRFNGILRGFNLTPPVQSEGLGTAQMTLTGAEVMWIVSFYGLSSSPTGVYIHGPADLEEKPAAASRQAKDSPVLFDLGTNGKPAGRNNWLVGKASLSAAQLADLNAGKWYVMVHSETLPQGELRGTIKLFEN